MYARTHECTHTHIHTHTNNMTICGFTASACLQCWAIDFKPEVHKFWPRAQSHGRGGGWGRGGLAPALEELDVGGNPLTSGAGRQLLRLAQGNPRLVLIALDGTAVPGAASRATVRLKGGAAISQFGTHHCL